MSYEQRVRQYNQNGNGLVSTRYIFSHCQILLFFISSAGYLFHIISRSTCKTNHFEAWRCENHKRGNSNHAEEWDWLMENFKRAEHHSWATVTAGSYSVDLEFDSRLGDLLWSSSATAYKFKDNGSNGLQHFSHNLPISAFIITLLFSDPDLTSCSDGKKKKR